MPRSTVLESGAGSSGSNKGQSITPPLCSSSSSTPAAAAATTTTSRINVYVRIRPQQSSSGGGGGNSKICVQAATPQSSGSSSSKKRSRNLATTTHSTQQRSVAATQQQLVVTCQERGGSSSSGGGGQTQKTYSFDEVFDHTATQSQVFERAARHVIDEVLEGYNCTLFAYGQTGTGKTFTMSGAGAGELSQENNGASADCEDESAIGIIPRSLKCLFEHFENNPELETVMKLSFVELYNEELYDLLSQEENSNARVKIFDDKDGKLQISGMEEKVASTLQDALRIFDYGTKRRSTTETLMNRESSRSHSVFILSIFMQESGIENTGIVKCGKLNLVDLAGSENISKSGVTDKQKREASNINQSLLTLGRVINMLSTGANTYIPYRDSKLTRILKDSLGGKTKTSMIATVSPTLSNLEETISTLEYAHQSKNIKNRPEINRKVTQNAIHKNMTHELQKLQRDLEAQRSKSGVYVDQDNYNAMQNELSDNRQKLEQQESLLEEYRDENRQFHSGLEKCLSIIDYYEPRAKEFYRNIQDKHAALENFAKFYNIDLTGFYNRLRNILPKNAEVFDTLCQANKRALPQFREFFDLLADDLKCFMAKEFQIVKKSIAGHEEWPAMMQCNLQSSGENLRQKLEELQSADSKFHTSHLQFLLEEFKQNSESVKKAEQCRDSLHAAIEKLSKSFLHGCNTFLDENSKCVSSLSSTCDNQNRQNNQLGQCIPAVQRLIDDYQTKVVEKIEGKLDESERRLQGALATIDNLKQELSETCSELACLKQDASRQWSVFKDEASTLTNMQLTSIEDSKHSTSQLQIAMNRNKAIFHEFSQTFMPGFVQQVEDAAADLQRSMQAKVIDRMTATGQAFDNQHTTFQSFEAAHQGQVKAVKTRGIDELTSSIMERLKRQPEVVIAEINAQQSRLDKFYASVQNALKSSTADLDKLIDEYYKAEKNHQALNDLEYPTCSESNKENAMPPALAPYTSIDPDFKEDELRHLIVKPMCDKVVKYEAPPQGAPSDTKDESVTTNLSDNSAKKSKTSD